MSYYRAAVGLFCITVSFSLISNVDGVNAAAKLYCMKPGSYNASSCLFDGPTCNWRTDFSNFNNEFVSYSDYQKNPIPTASSQFVVEAGMPKYVNGSLRFGVSNPIAPEVVGSGTIVSTSRFVHFGVIEVELIQTGVPGIVTSFIGFSNEEDEIDIEVTGIDKTNVQANWYAKGVEIKNKKGASIHGYTGNSVDDNSVGIHKYRLEWSADRIDWFVNGDLMHSAINDGKGFPDTPSRLSFGVWMTEPSTKWAGRSNAKTWTSQPVALFKSISVSCAANNGPPAVVSVAGEKQTQAPETSPAANHDISLIAVASFTSLLAALVI